MDRRGLCLVGVALAMLCAGCATTPTVPYRAPTVMINDMSAEEAKLEIIKNCIGGGGVVAVNTPTQLICSKPMDDSFGSLMYRALVTPRYSTNPEAKARYSFTEANGKLFIAIDMALEYENAFGQLNRTPITNGNIAANAQAMLDRIKAMHEGTAPVVQMIEEAGRSGSPAAASPAPAPQSDCKACAGLLGGH